MTRMTFVMRKHIAKTFYNLCGLKFQIDCDDLAYQKLYSRNSGFREIFLIINYFNNFNENVYL